MERQRHVLVVLPHPDDESGRAGTLASYIDQGTPVTYVCLTLGEMGRSMGNPPFANRVTLPAIRQKELEASCRSIGITDLRMFGLHDKTVEFEDQDALDARLRAVIDEVKPSLIITFYPGYSVHPDHDATGAAVIRTVGRMPAADRPAVHCVAFAKGCEEVLGPPDVVNDVSGYLQQKWGSFQAHRSQFAMFFGNQSLQDKEVQERLRTESFWTYRFE
ncbi:deacetylase [Gordoniibacillus kamchatkensis]|uniref:Deacetylase n=1 Tax=Gordoniibacillus kamchatkensis TaxID=1590651 RepID=A0ABR5AN92_9BACL|nr:bacillithiol biosynthesis deacetylase BshB2 [Paenibacillus sp. VKM B-2647]KIL42441.1 deacetylase [Paenibacillus sp. VKM B-2647]